MESNFPTELGNAYRSMENSGNPWGMSQAERADWADKLKGIEIVDGTDPLEAEYLYWVGCACCSTTRTRRSPPMLKLMQRAGISFAILGPSETCTGDPARRSGNEYIFQMLAMQNIETLNGMGVRKIVTQCPHCFNTLQNEYPQLGGNYEVVHHSQFLKWLIDQKKLDLSNAELDERIVYHDSCYLGLAHGRLPGTPQRHRFSRRRRDRRGRAHARRDVLRGRRRPDVDGGIHRQAGQRGAIPGAHRHRRRASPTACPFCYIMIDDGVKSQGIEEEEIRKVEQYAATGANKIFRRSPRIALKTGSTSSSRCSDRASRTAPSACRGAPARGGGHDRPPG